MPAPQFSAADYRQALANLMPRGRIWRRDVDSVAVRLLGALAPTYERSTQAAATLLADTLPPNTVNLLEEWEASLGLPDSCTPAGQSATQRQAAVAARWAARGGQTPAYFVKLAARLGYTVTVQSFAPARFGRATFGSPMYGVAWAHAWAIRAPLDAISFAEFGSARFGDPFSAWGNTLLECKVAAAAPAHTKVVFDYYATPETAVLGHFVLGYNLLG